MIFIRKNFNTIIFAFLLSILIFVPKAKALVIEGLMEVGFFQPEFASANQSSKIDVADIRFKNNDGKVVSLADLKGKIIFINFWATWCPPCLAEMPSINKLFERFKNDEKMVFLSVDADHDFTKAKTYLDLKGYHLPLFQPLGHLPKALYQGILPTTLVFDQQGRLSFKGEGATNYNSKKFLKFIEQLKALEN